MVCIHFAGYSTSGLKKNGNFQGLLTSNCIKKKIHILKELPRPKLRVWRINNENQPSRSRGAVGTEKIQKKYAYTIDPPVSHMGVILNK
jgi:hypothetical protein